MNILDFCKIDNLKKYIVEKKKIDNNEMNANMFNDILSFAKLCYEMSNDEFENIYIWFTNKFLNDIDSKMQDNQDITFNPDKVLFEDSFNDEISSYYLKLLKDYINEDYVFNLKKEITICKFYYLLSDFTEVYGIDNIKNTFNNDSKRKKYMI